MTKQLVPFDDINAVELFASQDAIDVLLGKIETEATSVVPDISTVKGRKNIASVAAQVARSKTYLDGLGKDIVFDAKATVKRVDGSRKTIRDFLDALKATVRAPLTEWEVTQKARVDDLHAQVVQIENLRLTPATESDEIEKDIAWLEALEISVEAFSEFAGPAAIAKVQALDFLRPRLVQRRKEESLSATAREDARLAEIAEQNRLRQELAVEAAEAAVCKERERVAALDRPSARSPAKPKGSDRQESPQADDDRSVAFAAAVEAFEAFGLSQAAALGAMMAIDADGIPGVRFEF